MAMSEEDQRTLRELEAQFAGQPELAALVRRLESPRAKTRQRRLSALWAVGASIGLVLVGVAASVQSAVLAAAAVAVLAGSFMLVGAAGLVVDAVGARRNQRLAHGGAPWAPSG